MLQLAAECKRALLPHTNLSDNLVTKALEMCNKYLPKELEGQNPKVTASLKQLWETAESKENEPARVLGEDLVNVITEKNRQPPDVSHIYQLIV